MSNVTICFKIRRYDSAIPHMSERTCDFALDMDYSTLKQQLQDLCSVTAEDNKVLKLRREDEVLVPFSYLLEQDEDRPCFYIDVCNINYSSKTASLLQDAYIDSVCEKLRNMESRIVKAELLLPQLEWRRQAHMEDTVNNLSNKVAFLNRRVDELLPTQWQSKMPQTMA